MSWCKMPVVSIHPVIELQAFEGDFVLFLGHF